MPHFIRSRITIMLPLADGRSPREITERTNELDAAVHALTEALHADNVTVSEPEIALVRAKGEPEPSATTLDLPNVVGAPDAPPTRDPPPPGDTIADEEIPAMLRRKS